MDNSVVRPGGVKRMIIYLSDILVNAMAFGVGVFSAGAECQGRYLMQQGIMGLARKCVACGCNQGTRP
jgi:hypothetical protein